MVTLPLKTKPEWYRAKNCTVLAACWQRLHWIIKAVRVLSILISRAGGASHDINSSWRLIYGLFFCQQKKWTERCKNTRNAATQSWHRCHTFLGLKRTSSVLGTARLQHGFGSISPVLAGENVPSQAGCVPARFIKASWASTAWFQGTRLCTAQPLCLLTLSSL